jgi:hypothetical protein
VTAEADGWVRIEVAAGAPVYAPIGGPVVAAGLGLATIATDLEQVELDGLATPPALGAEIMEGDAIGVSTGPLRLRVWRSTRPHRSRPWGPLVVVDGVDELSRAAAVGG